MAFFTYIVASGRNGTLYTGSTDDLAARICQHKSGTFGGFTARYYVNHLVWYEVHESRDAAFRRERQSKKWNRVRKLELIETTNPAWRDLYNEFRLQGLMDARDWVPASAGMSGSENG